VSAPAGVLAISPKAPTVWRTLPFIHGNRLQLSSAGLIMRQSERLSCFFNYIISIQHQRSSSYEPASSDHFGHCSQLAIRRRLRPVEPTGSRQPGAARTCGRATGCTASSDPGCITSRPRQRQRNPGSSASSSSSAGCSSTGSGTNCGTSRASGSDGRTCRQVDDSGFCGTSSDRLVASAAKQFDARGPVFIAGSPGLGPW
jgi:hypothetical protein